MKERKYSKVLALLLIVVFVLSMTACGGSKDSKSAVSETTNSDAAITAAPDKSIASDTAEEVSYDTDWAIYWYICGSDLESEGGAATIDMSELLEVKLPENVKVVIQTGGASAWQNEFVNPQYLERYVYDSKGLQLVDQQPLASMGSEETLSEFLGFAKANYPAKKTAVIFWNHGGGSVSGAEFDENFSNDSLTITEMHNAFAANYELSTENQPFDLIGFDTCLMATVDVASTFSDIGKYLVASEETEPSNGWNYTDWAAALGAKPVMEASELGKVICDTYQSGCELVGTQDNITLSLINLSKVANLVAAYNDFGKEALARACTDPSFFSYFGRAAAVTENYGGNTKEQGYTNMVDLGDLARQSKDILLDTSSVVLAALADCVEYKVNGPYRAQSSGLSCYYSYNADVDDYIKYSEVGTGEAFKYFFAYGLTGELNDQGMDYIAQMSYDTLKPIETLDTQGWEEHPVDVDSEGSAVLTLGENAINILSGMYIQLYYADPEQDIMLLLGSDNDLVPDWDTGVFKDNFRGVWGAINGCLVNMELSYEGDGYNLYNVPILLNGEEYNLCVAYDYVTAAYSIQGARKPIDESGMADKNLRYFVEGDVITTIHYAMPLSGEDGELTPVPIDEITVDENLAFSEIDLGEGMFLQMFEMRDAQGNSVLSDVIVFDIAADGTITTSTGYNE